MAIHNNDPADAQRTHNLSSQSVAQQAQAQSQSAQASSPHSSEHLRAEENKRTEQTKHTAPAAESKKAHEVDDGNKLEKTNKTEDWKNFSGSHVPPSAPPLQSQSAGTATPVEGSKNISAAQLRRDLERGVKA